MTKEELSDVFQETVEIVKEGKYMSDDGVEIIIPDKYPMVNFTDFRSNKINVEYSVLEQFTTNILVLNRDCLELARDLAKDGNNVAVLNMASFAKPGGGVLNGSRAQEENIFRRTNLFESLYQYHDIGKEFGVNQKKDRYPLDYNYGVIYTPNVFVFRGSDNTSYRLLSEPYEVDVISCSAIRRPILDRNGHYTKAQEETIKNKIRQIFDIALVHGNDTLVLGAFGCGAYGNPPAEMAKIFHSVINEEYKTSFKNIAFAIIDDGNSHKEHNPNGNYMPFASEFES